jgi:hypothetical protein
MAEFRPNFEFLGLSEADLRSFPFFGQHPRSHDLESIVDLRE